MRPLALLWMAGALWAAARDTAAVQTLIDHAARQGGGTVVLAAGQYLCGTLHLRSHVTLHLSTGATLRMSPENGDFDPYEELPYKTHADRETSFFHYALLAGDGAEDVAIEGQGAIAGSRGNRGGPKPIALKRCRRVKIRDVHILDAPNYAISMLGCEDVEVSGVTIQNGSSDGIDPDCCRFVRISNCYIESIDDAICLKTSLALGERRPTEHVTITNCVLHSLSINIKMGTESAGDFRDVAISNCAMYGTGKGRHGNPGVALETVDGGSIRGVTVSNISMHGVGIPFFLRLGGRGRGQATPAPGVLEDVSFHNIVATGATRTCPIAGLAGHPIRRVSLSDMRLEFEPIRDGPVPKEVPEIPQSYPDPTNFGALPAFGIWARHVEGLTLRGVNVTSKTPDPRPGLLFDDVAQISGSLPALTH